MKKYRRKVLLFSLKKLFIIAFLLVGIVILGFISSVEFNAVCIIFSGIAVTLLFLGLFAKLGVAGRYRYSKKSIEIFFGSFMCKKISFENIYGVVISNASYNCGRGDQLCYSIPMQYTVKSSDGKMQVPYPFISLLKQHYPIDQLKVGLSSRDLEAINADKIYCLGICWPESLDELMKHTEIPVYILEDVYFRFKGLFDTTFAAYLKGNRQLFIVTDQIVPYEKYLAN